MICTDVSSPAGAVNALIAPDADSSGARGLFGLKLEKVCRLCRRHRRGAAAVEFAIVAPVFFLFVFGLIEFGRLVMVQQVITNASREGARLGVLDGTTTADIENSVTNYLTSAAVNAPGANVTVTPNPPGSANSGDPVEVTVSIPFNEVSWLPTPMFLGGYTLQASTVMRRESVQ